MKNFMQVYGPDEIARLDEDEPVECWLYGTPIGLNDVTAERAPDTPGVYALLEGETMIYLGFALSSIRRKLRQHIQGGEVPCSRTATHYTADECDDPRGLHEQLLNFYREVGEYPRCNEDRS